MCPTYLSNVLINWLYNDNVKVIPIRGIYLQIVSLNQLELNNMSLYTCFGDMEKTVMYEMSKCGLHCLQVLPPGRKGQLQMSGSDVMKTQEVANRRIYIEQAIRRIKCFKFLQEEVPINHKQINIQM